MAKESSQDEGQGSHGKGGWKVIPWSLSREVQALGNKILEEFIRTLNTFKKLRGAIGNISVCFKRSASGSELFTQLIPGSKCGELSRPCPFFR